MLQGVFSEATPKQGADIVLVADGSSTSSNFACGMLWVNHHCNMKKRVHSFPTESALCVAPPRDRNGGTKERQRSWKPEKDRTDQGCGENSAKSLHLHPAFRHDISLGVNIPSTCVCLKTKESLCGSNAATPAEG